MSPRGAATLEGPIRRIGVVLRRTDADVASVVGRLADCCARRGVAMTFEPDVTLPLPEGAERSRLADTELDLVVALGGDGTLLRAARSTLGLGAPVFGVNLGHLGFLTGASAEQLEPAFESVLDGGAVLDYRFTLRAEIHDDGRGLDGEPFVALNDVVIHTSGAARVTPLDLSVRLDGQVDEIGSFSADGVILATPTGSTAYSMSAGGPIIVPEVEAIVVTAICPHSLAVRPLVVPAREQITVRSLDTSAELQLTVDGQVVRALRAGERVVVGRGRHEVALVRLAGETFFGTMRRKLNWAARSPDRA